MIPQFNILVWNQIFGQLITSSSSGMIFLGPTVVVTMRDTEKNDLIDLLVTSSSSVV